VVHVTRNNQGSGEVGGGGSQKRGFEWGGPLKPITKMTFLGKGKEVGKKRSPAPVNRVGGVTLGFKGSGIPGHAVKGIADKQKKPWGSGVGHVRPAWSGQGWWGPPEKTTVLHDGWVTKKRTGGKGSKKI